ncbi:MAG: DUF1543 domain-containing protein [Bacteroidota bacterium]|nr:DUF1543 domain-containing protein [Bacteroidota bacterium]
MEAHPKLFMLLVGCTPPGRYTEQHDVYFQIGNSIADLIPGIIEFWPEANGDIHLDAWREVTNVDGYTVEIGPSNSPAGSAINSDDNRLFFLNLGGYKKDEFEEFHYKMLAVAKEKGEAVRQAKKTAFYKHTGFKGADSHIDDKYGIDVDDVYAIEDILPADNKSKYTIEISESLTDHEDEMHLGYFTFQKLLLQKKF